MFRKLLATTAVAALLTGAAIAQQQPAPADPATQTPPPAAAPAEPAQAQTPPAAEAPAATAAMPAKMDGQLASNIIGESVYNGMADNAENIGDVNDIVLDADGKIKSLIVGVGGFLGVGEKNVEVPYEGAEWAEKNGDRWIVVSTLTKEALESQAAFDRAPFDPVAPAPTATPAAPAADPTAPPPKPAN